MQQEDKYTAYTNRTYWVNTPVNTEGLMIEVGVCVWVSFRFAPGSLLGNTYSPVCQRECVCVGVCIFTANAWVCNNCRAPNCSHPDYMSMLTWVRWWETTCGAQPGERWWKAATNSLPLPKLQAWISERWKRVNARWERGLVLLV